MDQHTTSWAAAVLLNLISYFAGALSALLLVGLVRVFRRAAREGGYGDRDD